MAKTLFLMADILLGGRDLWRKQFTYGGYEHPPLARCVGDRLGPDAKGIAARGSWGQELVSRVT
jgi:hypothetical protein